jgi:formylmethanofuran dehydrogenase subunit E
MAATFVNLISGKAVRVTALEDARDLAKQYAPQVDDKYRQQLEAYRIMPEENLFKIEQVKVTIPECDLPGRPMKRVLCEECGDWVQDSREIIKEGRTLCKNCAYGRYYEVI